MFGRGWKIELTALQPMLFGFLILRMDWTMRSLLLSRCRLGKSLEALRSSLDGRKHCLIY